VWKQWSESENVMRWWGPKGFTSPLAFKSLGDKKTEMTVSEYGYTTDQAVETSKAGLEQCLDKMAENLK
jgi:hypothetical protein